MIVIFLNVAILFKIWYDLLNILCQIYKDLCFILDEVAHTDQLHTLDFW